MLINKDINKMSCSSCKNSKIKITIKERKEVEELFFNFLEEAEVVPSTAGSTTTQFSKVEIADCLKEMIEGLSNAEDDSILKTIATKFSSKAYARITPPETIDLSKFNEFSTKYPTDTLEDQANDLENLLDEICSLKKPIIFDILSDGPDLLTSAFEKTLNTGFGLLVDSTTQNIDEEKIKSIKSIKSIIYGGIVRKKICVCVGKLKKIFQN